MYLIPVWTSFPWILAGFWRILEGLEGKNQAKIHYKSKNVKIWKTLQNTGRGDKIKGRKRKQRHKIIIKIEAGAFWKALYEKNVPKSRPKGFQAPSEFDLGRVWNSKIVSWTPLGRSGATLRRFLGVSRAHLRCLLGVLGASWTIWRHLWGIWKGPGRLLVWFYKGFAGQNILFPWALNHFFLSFRIGLRAPFCSPGYRKMLGPYLYYFKVPLHVFGNFAHQVLPCRIWSTAYWL